MRFILAFSPGLYIFENFQNKMSILKMSETNRIGKNNMNSHILM